ncbi:MAG: alpha/beta hydrolase [Proteobacteria bacterium]|nr:alpha/beta hydrolase [Pseudomonadota bacterium]
MPSTVILSHGSDSGPDATKVGALAKVAEELGWDSMRPDFREADKLGHAGSVQPRVDRLVAVARAAAQPLVLAGSSMGAFVSGLASLHVPCAGIFLIALPMAIPRWSQRFDMAAGVPAMIVHGFNDELCPVMQAAVFANARRIPILLLPDDHRLSAHVAMVADQFRGFLQSLPR